MPEELGLDVPGEPLGAVEVDPEPGDDGLADGDVVVGGDADGVRSPGRSLVRVSVSVHAVASMATSARAEMLSNVLFMNAPPQGTSYHAPV